MAFEEHNKALQSEVWEERKNEIGLWEVGAIGAWPLPSCNIVHGKLLIDSQKDFSLHMTFTEEHPFESVDLLYFADFIVPEAQRRVMEFAHWYRRYSENKQSQDMNQSLIAQTEGNHKS